MSIVSSLRPSGEIRIGERAVAALIRRAARSVEGCAGLAPSPGSLRVQASTTGLTVEVSILIIYGAAIESTAQAVAARISTILQQQLGQSVTNLHVYVGGLYRS